MQRLKISPSVIEAFRKGRLFNNTDDQLAALFTGEFTANEHTSIGSAVGRLIERGEAQAGHWQDGTYHVHEPDLAVTWLLSTNLVEAIENFRGFYKPLVFEVKGEANNAFGGYAIRSPLRLDGIGGRVIHEFKTSTSKYPVEVESYASSVQWRMYLQAFPEAISVLYSVFELKRNKKNPMLLALKDLHQFTFERDSSLDEYVQSETLEVIEFCRLRGLLHHIIEP